MAQLVDERAVPAGSGPQDPEEAKSWRLGRVLLESAREEARYRTDNFYQDWKFTLGEDHWPNPTSYRALLADRWKARTVRNWLWATIDHKCAVVLDAEPMIHVEALNDSVDFLTRQKIAGALRHELQRLEWNLRVEDAFLDGAVLGKGLVHLRTRKNKHSLQYELLLEQVDPQRFYPDPSASRLCDCRFIVYEPILDLSTVREIFPQKAHLVKPTITTDLFRYQDASGYSRSDVDLVEGTTGQEYVYGRDGKVKQRRAEVAFIWIKDETLTEDINVSIIRDRMDGYECTDCGSQFEPQELLPQVDDATGEMDPDVRLCPDCASQNLKQTSLEAVTESTVQQRLKFPYGRLICMSGQVLLYDGPNPHEIEEVFPFAEYNHYRVPRRFWGYGDTALLKSAQRVADKTMAQALDAMRLMANGPFEYPAEAEAYAALGNSPGQLVPVPAPYVGMAHYVQPNGFDKQLLQIIDAINMSDFQRVGAVSDVSSGVAPTAATSGVEVQARQRAASTRLGQHLRRLNKFRSDLANIACQMMMQYYVGEMMFQGPEPMPQQPQAPLHPAIGGMETGAIGGMRMGDMPQPDPMTESGSIVIDLSMMPRVRVRVTADPDDIERDKLMGQNLVSMITSGMLTNPMVLPFLDVVLRGLGMNETMANEMQQRVKVLLMQQPAQPVGPSNGDAGTSSPPSETSPDVATGGPQLNADQAAA